MGWQRARSVAAQLLGALQLRHEVFDVQRWKRRDRYRPAGTEVDRQVRDCRVVWGFDHPSGSHRRPTARTAGAPGADLGDLLVDLPNHEPIDRLGVVRA